MPFEEHNSNGVSLPSCDLAFYRDPYNILHLMLPAWARNLCYEERDAETVRDFFYRTLYMGSFPTFVTIHLFLWALWQIVWLNCFTSIVTNSHLVRFCFYCFIFFVFLSKCVFSLSEKGRAVLLFQFRTDLWGNCALERCSFHSPYFEVFHAWGANF